MVNESCAEEKKRFPEKEKGRQCKQETQASKTVCNDWNSTGLSQVLRHIPTAIHLPLQSVSWFSLTSVSKAGLWSTRAGIFSSKIASNFVHILK